MGEKDDKIILDFVYKNGKVPVENGKDVAVMPKSGISSITPSNGKCDSDGEEEVEGTCGLGPMSPKWLQAFASKQAFLVTFCLTWVVQGMFATYFVSVITTIEKLFQLQSKTTGMIMSATEIGQIGSTLLFTYYGGHGHRPRWIASGMVLFALCSMMCALPHFLFGYQAFNADLGANATAMGEAAVCHLDQWHVNHTLMQCTEKIVSGGDRETTYMKNVVLAIFLVSLLGVGIGQTPVYTLGISYIDDNVASRESPFYFAVTIGLRILGPAFGFIMGSVCTRIFVDLSTDRRISPTDTRWIGAWWLGLVLDSVLLLFASLAMFSFPKRLKTFRASEPAIRSRLEAKRRKGPKLRDFPKTIKRLIKNDILMFRTASSVLHILPIAGLYTFLPKFLESQFRFPAHTANMAAGVGGILVMGVGIIVSGVFILKMKPNARFVAAWIAGAAILYAIGMGILIFVGCPMDDIAGIRNHASVMKVYHSDCELTCHCNATKFSPVCGSDKLTYFSACHAGCQNASVRNGIIEFSDCHCLKEGSGGTADMGFCQTDCNSFFWYILVFSIFVFIHSTSEVGSMLLTLRCVDPRDKAMALGVIQFAIGLFGNVPCSVIYGAVVDSACLVWEHVCGKFGACSLYDSKAFRTYFHGTTSGIMVLAFVVDMVVWYKADNINFGTEDTIVPVEEELTPIAERSQVDEKEVVGIVESGT